MAWYSREPRVRIDGVDLETSCAVRVPDGHLHPRTDAVCPRCLTWIEEREFVRQTAYGPLQHEVCPTG